MKKSGVLLIILLILSGVSNGLFAQYQLAGTVNYNGNDTLPIPEVMVGLYDMQDVLVMSTETDENGDYLLRNIPGGEYYLRSTTDMELDLVNIQDSYLVLMYLLDWVELDDIQLQAADIDNSGSVSWYDYSFIVNNYLIYGETFPAGVWQFEEVYIDYTSREDPPDTTDLWGITEGDVDGVWMPSGRDFNILDFSHYTVPVTNTELQLKVKTNYKDQISGFSINLAYPADQMSIVDVAGPDGNLNYFVDETRGMVRINWLDENQNADISGDNLITLTVEAKSGDISNTTFDLLNGSMVLDAGGKEIKDVEIQLPMLEKNLDVEVNVSAYPNPFVDALHIGLKLDEANVASVSVFDVSGKLVVEMDNISVVEGEQLITVNTQDLMPGYYFYMIDLVGSTKYRATGQIVKSN